MKFKTQATIIVLLLFSINCSAEEYVEFDPPLLLLLKPEEAKKLPLLVESPPYDETFKAMQAAADSFLTHTPKPIKVIRYQGLVSNHPKRIKSVKHLQDIIKIHKLTWVYFVSQDKKYAAKAVEFINAWANVYKASGNDVNDNKLEKCWVGFHMLRDFFSEAEQKKVADWIKSIGKALEKGIKHYRAGNMELKRAKNVLFAYYIADDKAGMKSIEPRIRKLWNISLKGDGKTSDLLARDAMHYHYSTLRSMIAIAQIGRIIGKDYYNLKADNGGSIAKSIEFSMPYIRGEKVYPEWVNTTARLDKYRWYKAKDPYYKPGKPWDPWEAYEPLLLGAAFNDTLFKIAQKIRKDANEPPQWLEVLSRATQRQAKGRKRT